jgi:AraC-like DNA-binding protein
MFRETFGTSPMHYLIRRRIEHAQELLRITDLPLQEIARRCGIDNPYYFSRLFRKVVGQTASRYRRTNCRQQQ